MLPHNGPTQTNVKSVTQTVNQQTLRTVLKPLATGESHTSPKRQILEEPAVLGDKHTLSGHALHAEASRSCGLAFSIARAEAQDAVIVRVRDKKTPIDICDAARVVQLVQLRPRAQAARHDGRRKARFEAQDAVVVRVSDEEDGAVGREAARPMEFIQAIALAPTSNNFAERAALGEPQNTYARPTQLG